MLDFLQRVSVMGRSPSVRDGKLRFKTQIATTGSIHTVSAFNRGSTPLSSSYVDRNVKSTDAGKLKKDGKMTSTKGD